MLHVLNGEAVRPGFEAAGIEGRTVTVPDQHSEGPAGAALRDRAAWLTTHYNVHPGTYQGRVAAFDNALRNAAAADVVLWFEDDWFCHANLMHVLSHWRAAAEGALVLTPGPLAKANLAEAFEAREAVGDDRVALARTAWRAFAAREPTALPAFVASADFSAWPGLERGLRFHLSRFPDDARGLGADEAAVLDALADDALSQTALFDATFGGPLAHTGFTPAQLAVVVAGLGDLVEVADAGVTRTALGSAVAAGDKNRVAAVGIERVLGGVHVHARPA